MRPYDHLERYGNDEVQGIDVGTVHVQPKLDGTNARVALTADGSLRVGSRNRVIAPGNDNHGFAAWCHEEPNKIRLNQLIDTMANLDGDRAYDQFTVYGEWLVKHSLGTYRDDAWRRFWIFDVHNGEEYLPPEVWHPHATNLGLDAVDTVAIITNPTEDQLRGLVESNTFLIKDGEGIGEGIVIKQFGWRNGFGRQPWAKIVRNEFKEMNRKAMGLKGTEGHPVEADIATHCVTRALVDKERAKIGEVDRSVLIPRLLGTVYHCVVTEELWNALKKFKNPTVNFKKLQQHVMHATKLAAPDLF